MSADFLILLGLCILAFAAHGCRYYTWLGWVIRGFISLVLLVELLGIIGWLLYGLPARWEFVSVCLLTAATATVLFKFGRRMFSFFLSALDLIVSGEFVPLLASPANGFSNWWQDKQIFVPNSMPHLAGLWVYLTCLWFLLGDIKPSNFSLPEIPIAIPVAIDQLFVYNGLGLVLLAVCAVGIFVARRPLEVLKRLGIVKPSIRHVLIGGAIVVGSLLYDYAWSLFTHQLPGNLASQLSAYNTGSFSAGVGHGGGMLQGSLVLALATGLCAGIGEETLMRGALQPVFGILPTALIHGLAHGQFSHAPIFIIQITLWSALMCIVRRHTNTTTTIIGHVFYNFVLTFLFAFNP